MSEVINGDHKTDAPDAYDSSPNDPSKFYSHHANGRPASHTVMREAWMQRITADFEADHGTEQAASDAAAANWAALGENAEGTSAQARQRATSAHLAKLAKYRRRTPPASHSVPQTNQKQAPAIPRASHGTHSLGADPSTSMGGLRPRRLPGHFKIVHRLLHTHRQLQKRNERGYRLDMPPPRHRI